MEPTAKTPLPTLRSLLAKRGLTPDSKFDDYQSYIEAQSTQLKAGTVSDKVALSNRDMHVALGRFSTSRKGAF